MKFNVHTSEKCVLTVLENESVDFQKVGNEYVIECETAKEIFELGELVGRERYSEKSQSFLLDIDYIPILEEAIRKTENETHITNKTIFIKDENQGCPQVKTVLFYPTTISFLFNCFRNYGMLFEKKKSEGLIS